MGKVNHAFYDLILASPSIQYEVDLFDAGLQPNPRTKASLADCRAALEAYSRRWGALDPAEKWDKSLDVSTILEAVVVSGTYGILWVNSIKFFTLGSVSRVFQGGSGKSRSSTLKLAFSRSTLKLTLWPSSRKWRGRELHLCVPRTC